MNIQNNNFYAPQFTSKLNPINPTVIRTKYGKLNLREVRKADLANPKFLEKLSKFYCANFSTCTDDPSWIMYNTVPKRIKNQIEKLTELETPDDELIEVLKDKYIGYMEDVTRSKSVIMIIGVCIIVLNLATMSVYPLILEANEALKVMLK